MPKVKTKKAVKKRFKITGTGKVMAAYSFRRHLLADRTPKRKRQARGLHEIDVTDRYKIKELLPYQR